MLSEPKVSVLMSVYNGGLYLREAIRSILNQSFTDYEFIIVDDGSVDETWSILESCEDSRVRPLCNSKNIGLTRSLNRGLSVARGAYIARQDADDRSFPERLATQVEFLDTNHQTSLVGTAYKQVFDDGRESRVVTMPQNHEEICDQLFYQHAFCHGSVMMRRGALEAVGGYNEEFAVAQDQELWLRMAEQFRTANLPDILYQLRVSRGSVTGQQRILQRRNSLIAATKALERQYLQPSSRALGRLYWLLALEALVQDEPESATQHLQEASRVNASLELDADYLIKQAVYRAFEVSKSSENLASDRPAFQLLESLFSLLQSADTSLNRHRQWALAELHAAHAFAAFAEGNFRATRSNCIWAWWLNAAQLRNIGLLSIFIRSHACSKE